MTIIYWVTETPNHESDSCHPTVEPVFFASAYDQQEYIKSEIEDQTYGNDAPVITDMGEDGIREVSFMFHTLLAGKTSLPVRRYLEEADYCDPKPIAEMNRILAGGDA